MEKKTKECYHGQKPETLVSKKLLLSPIYVKREHHDGGEWCLQQQGDAGKNREKCTQTSKTIIELARYDERNMYQKNNFHTEPFNDCNLRKIGNRKQLNEGRTGDQISDEKSNCYYGANYLLKPNQAFEIPSSKQTVNYLMRTSYDGDGSKQNPKKPSLVPNMPIVVNIINSKGERAGDVKQYLTQKNQVLHNLKSQSFIESSNVKRYEAKRLNNTRPQQPKVPEPPRISEVERSHCVELNQRSHIRRSNSFMSPGDGIKYHIDMPRFDETPKSKITFPRRPSISETFNINKKPDADVYVPVHNNCSMSTLFLSSEGGLCSIMCHVKSGDWSVALKGLAEIVDLAIICDVELLMPIMSGVNHKLLELLKSPRSHVCRSACQIAGQLFETIKDTRRPEFDDIVYVLLTKTADANKFIRHDANVALDSMVTHVPIFHSVRSVCSKGPSHRNPLVRCAAVRILICAVVMAGPDTVLNNSANESTRRRIVVNLGTFLEDKNLETRRYAERLYKILEKQGNLEYFLKKYLEREKFDTISRFLKANQKCSAMR